jgi:amidase
MGRSKAGENTEAFFREGRALTARKQLQGMSRIGTTRRVLGVITWTLLAACVSNVSSDFGDAELVELTAPELARHIAEGRATAERVTRVYLERIAALDRAGPALHAVIELNPDALAIARALDRRFEAEGPIGPLHGIPVMLKANIDTGDRMITSAGSLALAEHRAEADAVLVRRLREAGAVILGKTNLSEWANFRARRSVSGWSSLGGQTLHPYVLDRNPCGSSSGSAVVVAARLAPLAVGTETDGSIVCPAGATGVAAIKPTLGLVSQNGIVPLAASFDTAGPMARTVAGAAMLLAAMAEPTAWFSHDDAAELGGGLAGVRLGVVRDFFGAGAHAPVETQYAFWLEILREGGAELVDPVAVGLDGALHAAQLEVLLFEFKDGLERYLGEVAAGPSSIAELIAFNDEHAERVMPHFGQDLLVDAEAKPALDDAAYRRAVEDSIERLQAMLEALFDAHQLDALVAPVNAPAWRIDWVNGDSFELSSSSIAAISGYPSVAVPAGLASGLPLAVAFIGPPEQEARLIEIAAAFERARGAFPPPTFLPSLEAH